MWFIGLYPTHNNSDENLQFEVIYWEDNQQEVKAIRVVEALKTRKGESTVVIEML